MEGLLKPDFGVTILTICNFLLLVYLLKKFAWEGVVNALEKREQQIADDKKQAQEARETAQQLKTQLEEQLNHVAQEASQKIAQAVKTGETQRQQLVAAGNEQARRLVEQARMQIEAEKNKALDEVRNEMVRVAVLASGKIVRQEINPSSARAAVERTLKEIETK